jgi:deazaflavin-dependent oxidoreductase (nitroreductase family)
VPGIAILETTGRNSGQPRRTPVGRSLNGNTGWIVAERVSYVRNIQADPSVGIKLGRRWRTGTAHVMPDDDPRARQHAMPAANAAVVRVMARSCSPCGSKSTANAAADRRGCNSQRPAVLSPGGDRTSNAGRRQRDRAPSARP